MIITIERVCSYPAFGEIELDVDQGKFIAPAKAGKHGNLTILDLSHPTGPSALHAYGGIALFYLAKV